MPALVSFIRHGGLGSVHVRGISGARVTESVALNGTTTAVAQSEEAVFVANTEASMIRVAWGSTPDAAATAETEQTSAGLAVPAGGISDVIIPKPGDKFNAKTA